MEKLSKFTPYEKKLLLSIGSNTYQYFFFHTGIGKYWIKVHPVSKKSIGTYWIQYLPILFFHETD